MCAQFARVKYDPNLRQLHEYEQRRTGKQKQLGIDISDVVGNRARTSDDYADYLYDANYFRGRDESWGQTSFRSRKANLLEYVELSMPELNNLMDHRDSVYSSGVSQYLARGKQTIQRVWSNLPTRGGVA